MRARLKRESERAIAAERAQQSALAELADERDATTGLRATLAAFQLRHQLAAGPGSSSSAAATTTAAPVSVERVPPGEVDALRAAVLQERSKAQKLELAYAEQSRRLEAALAQNADLRNKLHDAQQKRRGSFFG